MKKVDEESPIKTFNEFKRRYYPRSEQEPKAERSEVPLRETFALLPAAEVEELKSQLGEARQREEERYRQVHNMTFALDQAYQREQEMRQELAEIGVKFDHDDEPYNESANKLARVVSEYQELQQEMRGKLDEAISHLAWSGQTNPIAMRLLEEVLAAIKEGERNGN